MAGDWSGLSFFAFFVFSLSRLHLILGAARFTEQPPSPFPPVLQNTNVSLEWSYEIDTGKSEFDDNSPVWEYKEDGGTWKKIAFEDGFAMWKWTLSSECPAKFKNPVRRVEKGKTNAALVILNTNLNDTGLYRCTLVMRADNPVVSDEVRLVVRDSLPTTTAVSSTSGPTRTTKAFNGSTTISFPASSTPTPTPTLPPRKPCPEKHYEAIITFEANFTTVFKDHKDWLIKKIIDFFEKKLGFCDVYGENYNESFTMTLIFKTEVTKEDVLREFQAFADTMKDKVSIENISVEKIIDKDCLNTGEIAGIVIGVLAAVGLIAVIGVVIYKKVKTDDTRFSIAALVGIIIGVVVASGIVVAIVVAIYDRCMKAGLLVGITFGVLVAVLAIIAAIVVIIYKKKKNEQTNQQSSKPQIA